VSRIVGRPIVEDDTEDLEMELAELLEESQLTIPDLPTLNDLSSTSKEKLDKEAQYPHMQMLES